MREKCPRHTSDEKLSRFVSRHLRHTPEEIGITLDDEGYVDVDEFIAAVNRVYIMDREKLDSLVNNPDWTRFEYSEDGTKIRAEHGHSVPVHITRKECVPPDVLYHGTSEKSIGSIMENGLIRGNRDFVYISSDVETAVQVGSRHGPPVILEIDAKSMHEDGCVFYAAANGTWLTDYVLPRYIRKME